MCIVCRTKPSSGSLWDGLRLFSSGASTNTSTSSTGWDVPGASTIHMEARSGERKHADLRMAFDMLQKSCMTLVRQSAMALEQARRDASPGNASASRSLALPGPRQHPGQGWSSATPAGGVGSFTHQIYPYSQQGYHQQLYGSPVLPHQQPQYAGHIQGWPPDGDHALSGRGPRDGMAGLPSQQQQQQQNFEVPLPSSWGPWGCLVALCAALLQVGRIMPLCV